jgi:hypothetical protein
VIYIRNFATQLGNQRCNCQTQQLGQTVNLADDTANEWYITGVQLEAGTTASDFEFLPVDVNLGLDVIDIMNLL